VCPIAIYEWHAWNGYLLPTLLPSAIGVSARIGETSVEVERRTPADTTCFAFHLDLTHTSAMPTDRRALVDRLHARGITVINGLLTDISKRHVQSCSAASGFPMIIAEADGDPDELLIVKTDLNYGGHSERDIEPWERRHLGLPMADTWRRTSRTYTVVPRRAVPHDTWARADLLVERFVTNATGLFFRVHTFLDRMVVTAAVHPDPIKELAWGVPRQDFYFKGDRAAPDPAQVYDLSDACNRADIDANLPALRRFCRRIGLDFGAIDVVVDDHGQWYVVDANATPFWNRSDLEHLVQFLAGVD
jgi:hypothetical protein